MKLEDIAKSVMRMSYAVPVVIAASLYIPGCGDNKPSAECCEAKECSKRIDEEYGRYICSGEGDDCYCRPPGCCDRLECDVGQRCVPKLGKEGCECQYKPTSSDLPFSSN